MSAVISVQETSLQQQTATVTTAPTFPELLQQNMLAPTYHAAVARNGVCRGTLWRTVEEVASPSNSSSSGSSSSSEDYGVLLECRLHSFESATAHRRGDAPIFGIDILGASVWTKRDAKTLRIVTSMGTHILYQAPTQICRDRWLAHMQAGLALRVESPDVVPTVVLKPPQPKTITANANIIAASSVFRTTAPRHCQSCAAPENSTIQLQQRSLLWQYGRERASWVCRDCAAAQAVLDAVVFQQNAWIHQRRDRQALRAARELCRNALQLPSGNDNTDTTAAAAAQSGDAPTGDSASSSSSSGSSASWTQVSSSEQTAASGGSAGGGELAGNNSTNNQSLAGSWQAVSSPDSTSNQWVELPPTEETTQTLMVCFQTPEWQALERQSPRLQALTKAFLSGIWTVTECLAHLDEANHIVVPNSLIHLKQQALHCANDMGTALQLLYDQALNNSSSSSSSGSSANMNSNGMGANGGNNMDDGNNIMGSGNNGGGGNPSESYASLHSENTCLLQAVLDFFLDTVHQGDLESIAFYWQQICHIHLCMLPATDAASLARIDLMQDFLTTICHHSTHLALELVWFHWADLEEALDDSGNSSSASRHRRAAVTIFLIELEASLFDREGLWGNGGAVTVAQPFLRQPTPDQIELISRTLRRIATLRPPPLARSIRRQRTSRQQQQQNQQQQQQSAERAPDASPAGAEGSATEDAAAAAAVEHKIQVAKRCEYLSTHLEFTKRLGHIADQLFSIPDHSRRKSALQEELHRLNASGSMGGDPLLTTHDPRISTRVVRVPATEGHVFRSKERTPVLLLMEVVTEQPAAEQPQQTDQANNDINPTSPTKQNATTTMQFSTPERTASSSQTTSTTPESAAAAAARLQRQPSEGSSHHSEASFMEGDAEADLGSRTPKSTALKKLGASTSSLEPSVDVTPKQAVQKLVSSVMEQKDLGGLKMPDLASVADDNGDDNDNDKPPSPPTADGQPESLPSENLSPDTPTRSDVNGVSCDEKNDKSTPTRSASAPLSRVESPIESGAEAPPMATMGKRRTRSSALGSSATEVSVSSNIDTRREVLNAIMRKGFKGNAIAAGTAHSVQMSLQDLERKQATELLLDGKDDEGAGEAVDTSFVNLESTSQKLASLGLGGLSPKSTEKEEDLNGPPTEEDEAMESIRLLLIQNRVAQGQLSREDAAKVLQHASLVRNRADRSPEKESDVLRDFSDTPTIDAGDVDSRLVGCGPLPPAVLQALTLWKGGMVSNGELLELVKRDMEFIRHSVLVDSENVDKLTENSDFWGRFAFGERWAEKKSRIAATSPQGALPGWDLLGVIVKANDDLRQEAFVMQLIQLCKEAFELAGLELWVFPYRILATGRSTGIIEMVRNAMSFDALKKRPGYGKGGLREHLHRMTEFSANPGDAFRSAQENFVRSLAAYSLMSYFFMFKDRHNGNILLDTMGHVIHIDFGFVFGTAPGGNFSLELSTPFKLTEEMLDVMGGLKSPLFSEFVTLFCCGFLALQSHYHTFVTIVAIMSRDSTFPCFQGADAYDVVAKLRERFCPDSTKEETVAFALDLIKQATSSYGTRQYDLFQYMSQGIAA